MALKVVAFPEIWQKSFAGNRGDPLTDPRSIYLYNFSQAILEELQKDGRFTTLPAPAARHEVTIKNSGHGIRYEYAFSWSTLRVGVWINSPNGQVNLKVFEQLREQNGALEASVGGKLRWDYDASRHGQIVSIDKEGIDRNDISKVPALATWAAGTLVKIYDIFAPRVQAAVEVAQRVLGKL